MRERDNHDALLNEAIKHYADPGVDSGLEARMLARLDAFRSVTAAPTYAHRRWAWFAIASPVGACALLMFLAYSGLLHPGTAPQSHPEKIARKDAGPADAASQEQAAERPVHTRLRHERPRTTPREVASHAPIPTLPKLAMFPTIPSLTPEEHALLEWQRHAPESARAALVQPLPEPTHDIADLHIAPLELPNLGSE